MRCNLFLGAMSGQERDTMDMEVSFWNAEQAYHFFVLPSSQIYKLGEHSIDLFHIHCSIQVFFCFGWLWTPLSEFLTFCTSYSLLPFFKDSNF